MKKPATIMTDCPKCAGKGRLAHYQHVKGGECFCCGGQGRVAQATEVDMTPAEILAHFSAVTGLTLIDIPTVSSEDDWLSELFPDPETLKTAALAAETILMELKK